MRKNIKILVIAILIAMLIAGTFVVPATMAISGKTVKQYSVQSDEVTIDEEENETTSEEPENETSKTGEEEEESYEVEDEEEEQELDIMDEGNKVVIVSEDNEVEFEKEEPRLHFEYITEDGYEVKFEVRFKEIYEFVDTNGNGKLDSSEKVFDLDLEDLLWDIEVKNGTYVENNGTWYEITYSHVSEDFNITFIMHIYQKSVNAIDGGADEVKIDVLIDKWSWRNDSSFLALLTKIEIEVETEGEIQELLSPEANETGIYMKTAGDVFIKCEWTNEIFVDNELSSIVASYYKKIETEQEMEQEEEGIEQEVELEVDIFTVYPHFKTLRHDPSVGVEDDPKDVQWILQQMRSPQWYFQSKILVTIGILATAIVGVAAILKKNQKNKLKTMNIPI